LETSNKNLTKTIKSIQMKRSIYLLTAATLILASCGGGDTEKKKDAKADSTAVRKAVPVTVMEVQSAPFTAFIEIQSQIVGDENVNALPQAPGAVKSINVHVGQKVGKGQLLASIDAAAIDQQIKALEPNITLAKTVYEKQQKLWEQQIGTEVQLLQAKANYESAVAQKSALVAQRNMYRIVSPINGTVDQINLKVGDLAGGMNPNGIKVVDLDKMKAEAKLGENYLGKVKAGDRVIIVLPDVHDSIETKVSYVAQSVDPVSRAFTVEVKLGNNKKLRPNMSCQMKIANYKNDNAITVPVSVIQKTGEGELVYVAEGNKAKAVMVSTGNNSNGLVEILSGLEAGQKVIVEGFEELDNGAPISVK
jgi:RND family efflux transporter MFP subunit